MSRYFFDFYDGEIRRDARGIVCAGHDDIRREAMQALPDTARALIPRGDDKQVFTVSVRNENNIPVYMATLTFAGVRMGEDVPPAEEPAGHDLDQSN